jgi:colicin import membrane protein
MKRLTIGPVNRSRGAENGSQKAIRMFAVSALGHAIFFIILIFSPSQLLPAKQYTPSVINVSMVSLPEQNVSPGSAEPVVEKPAAYEPKPEIPEEKIEEAKAAEIQVSTPENQVEQSEKQLEKTPVSVASPNESPPSPNTISISPKKKKVKTSLKKKTFRSSQVIKKAIKRIEKKSVRERPKTVTDAIARLRKKVPQKDATKVAEAPQKNSGEGFGGTEQGTGIPGRLGVAGRKVLEQIDLYRFQIAYHIEKKWAFSEQLTGGRSDLEAILVIKIMPSGEIQDIWFEKKSGNNYFDDSAFKAIQKSNPLPPLPRGYLRPFYNVGLVFTPSGLKRGRG